MIHCNYTSVEILRELLHVAQCHYNIVIIINNKTGKAKQYKMKIQFKNIQETIKDYMKEDKIQRKKYIYKRMSFLPASHNVSQGAESNLLIASIVLFF